MSKKKEKPICLSKLEPEEKLKYEIAEELGIARPVVSKTMAGRRFLQKRPGESAD